ncbi:MAG: RidA family protein [Eubacteriales bacterium]|nr:RidA family protein [Eubacteriales bacterium]
MKQVLHTDNAPAAIGPYVQGWKVGQMVFTSGQLGIDMEKGGLAENVVAQAHASMRNVGEILKAGGATYGDIVKSTIFVKDLADFKAVNDVYASYFEGDYPARSCVQVAALPMGGLVEIEAVAVVDQ